MSSTWILVPDGPEVGPVIHAARTLGDPTVAVVLGLRETADAVADLVDRVLWVDPVAPVEAYASALAARAVADRPRAVLAGAGATARVLLGAVAGALHATALTEVVELARTGTGVRVTRSTFGGIAVEQDEIDGPLALVVTDAAGSLEAGAVGNAAAHARAEVEPLALEPAAVRLVETAVVPTERVDLAAATRVVAVGRGLAREADLAGVRELTEALGAELGCSRPVAEGAGWLPRDRYIGVSGQRVSPELYLALGISGQIQHMVGVHGAGTVVAVNTDPSAPIAAQSDYLVAGDLAGVVPALVRALGGGAR